MVHDDGEFESGFWRAALISGVLVVLAILAFGLSSAIADEYTITKHIFRDIGIALIVSAVIIFTIEARSRDELNRMVRGFLRRTHENLFQTILGIEFPKAMYDFVRDRLMKEPIYRTKTEVHYTIHPPTADAKERWGIQTLMLNSMFSYNLKNLSDREHKHEIRFFVEEPLDPDAAGETPLPRLIIDGSAIPPDKVRQADSRWQDRPGLRRFEYDLLISRQKEHSVEIHHSMRKLIADTETWRSLHPCDGLRLSITHPAEYSVGVDAMHPDDMTTVQDNEVSFIGQINRPLFPANGFLFWWHPKPLPQLKVVENITASIAPGVNPGATKAGDDG